MSLENLNVVNKLSANLFLIIKEGKFGLADNNGKILQNYEYDEISALNLDGFAHVKKGNKYGAIDKYGKLVYPCVIEEILFKVDNFAVVKEANKHVLIDTKTYSKKCEYNSISLIKSPYMQYLALVRRDVRVGILDVVNNVEIVESIYDSIEVLENKNYLVKRDNLQGILDERGNDILKCEYLEIIEDSNKITLTVQNADGKWGVVNKTTGKELVPCEFDSVESLNNEDVQLKKVVKDGKIGVYNTAKYEFVVPCIYDEFINDLDIGLIHVKKGNKYGLLNDKGQILVDCISDTMFEKVNKHFMRGGDIYFSLVSNQVFTKDQFELINKINCRQINYKELPKELISSARCLKELVELARADIKKQKNIETKDVDSFIDFTRSILDQKKKYEMSLCTENSTGLNLTEIQEFSDLCNRNIEVLSVNMVSVKELTYEFKDKENGGKN